MTRIAEAIAATVCKEQIERSGGRGVKRSGGEEAKRRGEGGGGDRI
jgi:hypothetical protein